MNQIYLQQTVPQVFAHREAIASEVWLRDVVFCKKKRYLIEAASGTGKSSLGSYLYGYRHDYQGCIRFDGRDIRTLSGEEWTEIRRHSLSIQFQELRLFPELTAMENVMLNNQLTHFKQQPEILSLFRAMGLADKAEERVGKLSFGQQQRVAFIRSLCQPFDFLFLDEPISHLDSENARVMSRLLTEEAHRQGAGIIVTSIGRRLELEYDEVYQL